MGDKYPYIRQSKTDLIEDLASSVFTDEFGRNIIRTSVITETGLALLRGRLFLCQTEDAVLDDGSYIEFVIRSEVPSPLVLLSLAITAQMEVLKLEIFEGGTASGGAMPTCIAPNRLVTVSHNTTMLEGTPSTPVIGDEGVAVTGPDGWKVIGTKGSGTADWVDTTLDIGGFICKPLTWYRLRVTNASGNNNRPIQMSLKYVDPDTPV